MFIAAIISIILAVISIIASIVSLVMGANTPRPREAEDKTYETPTQEVGVPIAVLFGTRIIKRPSVVWWGDLQTIKVPVPLASKK